MADLDKRPFGRWIGIAAAAWLAILAAAWLFIYSGIPLPRWEGVFRIVKEFALLAWLLGAAYGWGRLALRRWHTPRGGQPNPFWAFGLGFGVLWLATFAVAALHLLGPAWPWLLLGGGWVALLATLRPLPQLHLPTISTWTATEWFLLVAMTSSLGYSLFAWALVPPLAWDEVSYHLPIPQIFIRAGGFVNIPTIVHSNWPSGMEMLNTLALMMGSEILPHLTVTAMTVLTALGLAHLARHWFDRSTAWLAATLYLTTPMVKFLAGVALIEGALGFFGFLALWSGFAWLESRSWRALILAGILGGLAASIKLTGAAIPIAVGTVGLGWLLLRYRGEARRHAVQFAGYGLIAFMLVAPWYIKSTIYTGNPFWPFFYNVFGGRNWDAVGDQIHTAWLHRPNQSLTLWHYIRGFWYLAVRSGQFGGMSLGAAVVVLVPLSALFWNRRRWVVGYLVAVSGLVYTAWFFTTHQSRFLMGVVPALVLLGAFAYIRVLRLWPPRWAALGRMVMLLYLIVELPFVNADNWQRIADRWPYLAGRISRSEFLVSHVEGYSAFEFANEHLPGDAKVLLAPWETRGYYLDRASFWANPISQRVIKWEQFDDADTLAGFLHSLGITHVFWNSSLMIEGVENEDHTNVLFRTLLDEYGQVIYDGDGYRIYELRTTP
jgi:hypothetical protein